MDYFGYHLILDCKNGDKHLITDPNNIENFVNELVTTIKMIPFGLPQIVHFGHADPKTSGYTLMQLIETSAIMCHFIDESGDFYLDLFSCAEYNVEDAISVVKKYFNPQQIRQTYLTRQA